MKGSSVFLLASAIALAGGCGGSVTNGNPGGTGASGTGATGPGATGPGATGTGGNGSSTTGPGSTGPGAGGGACGGTFTRLSESGISKVDLVLMIDNSRSMADKQQVLSLAVPDLITGLLNPPCVDANGHPVATADQPTPTGACPPGTVRSFPVVTDMHIGLLSSSLGSFGADGCPDTVSGPDSPCANMATSTSNNDHGHLVTRTDPCATTTVPTWKSEGFLAWDPLQMLSPPGEGQLGSATSPGLVQSVSDLVVGDGQDGCGFESQNESWYRFLVDPSPYESIALNGQNVATTGVDSVLLQQRSDFMRSDSLLAIVVVTDETDTSIKESSFYPLFAQILENGQPFHLPTARSECTTKGPTDPCCASCGEAPPAGCPTDANCTDTPTYTDATENLAIRAFGLSGGLTSHKARYGIEFFYPPSRYVQALTSATVQDEEGKSVPNPIFSPNANEPGAAVRDPTQVVYATITGVPWQLIARQDANGTPDLVNGVSALDPTQIGGFKTYDELALEDAHGNTYWDDIAGDPENYVLPKSPFMQESTVPRTGTDPITGIATSPPTSAFGANPLNGHEWLVPQPPGDIEYACIFPLLEPRDCSQPGAVCDCTGQPAEDNPLCQPNPNDNGNLTLQVAAKAYPGVKNLAIAKGMQEQGFVGSICAEQLTSPTNPDGTPAIDYGYRPAVQGVVDQLSRRLARQCLATQLTPGADGQVACTVLEASKSASCDCTGAGKSPVTTANQCTVDAAKAEPLYATAQWNCFCEIDQTAGAALQDCEDNAAVASTTNGWCYVDGSTTPPVGNPALVAGCPSPDKHLVRFVGAGEPDAGSTIFLSCP